jgi:ubiquinone/menaquinone biosynthesis C-methylase UbiE
MDYDQTEIPATYDKARALAPETIRLWQDLLSVHIGRSDISLVIDLGCRFSELLAAHFGVQVIGIDPSLKMLDQARRKSTIANVAYWQGLAEALPLRDGCADLVFMSMVYQHFNDPPAVARECHRVLRQGGYACIRNGTRESDFPHRHFFPALRALIDPTSRRGGTSSQCSRRSGLRLPCIKLWRRSLPPIGPASLKNPPFQIIGNLISVALRRRPVYV